MTYLVFGRRRYEEPLAQLSSIAAEAPPQVTDLDIGDGWLHVVLVPEADVIWVMRDGDLVGNWAVAAP